MHGDYVGAARLHTSKRMHFIEDIQLRKCRRVRHACIRQNVCTSLRKGTVTGGLAVSPLAYVKTYALH